ncbi:hypothetical protein GCM10022223_49710 [Kineosporia mesophila]|uniref:Uncharacterized protein n=1 Tax=Kineosporia mesophila TaxID=566012 RepID=A0ABP7A7G6_9ACTN
MFPTGSAGSATPGRDSIVLRISRYNVPARRPVPTLARTALSGHPTGTDPVHRPGR